MGKLISVIVSARCSSSRLPNKALLKIKNSLRSIEIVIERAKLIGIPIILATSTDSSDDELEKIAKKHNILIFRGELNNKIKRWYDCFNQFNLKSAIEIDGDDLCYNFRLAKRALKEFKKETEIMIAPSNIIIGFFTYMISRNGIDKLYSVAKDENLNTDVITKYIEKAQLKSQTLIIKKNECNKEIRLTLDYEEDLIFFRKLYEKLDITTDTNKIIDFLIKNPDIPRINFCKQQDFINNQANFNSKI